MSGPLQSSPAQINSPSNPRLDPIDSKSISNNRCFKRKVSSKFDCLYLHNNVWEAATRAAGGTIDLVRAIIYGDIRNGMALVRPPGHHAMRDQVSL